jgi:hypothetical protein
MSRVLVLTADEVAGLLDVDALIDALARRWRISALGVRRCPSGAAPSSRG